MRTIKIMKNYKKLQCKKGILGKKEAQNNIFQNLCRKYMENVAINLLVSLPDLSFSNY